MKTVGLFLVLIFPVLSFSQKIFEGKITYVSHVMRDDSIFLINYFSPAKMRMEMLFSNEDLLNDSYILAFLESNIYYVVQPSRQITTRAIIDTSLIDVKDQIPVNNELNVLGLVCYGIKETRTFSLPILDSNIYLELISYYAKGLYYPYKITPYFTQCSMVYNNNICLSSRSSLGKSVHTEDKSVLVATQIEYGKNPDSLFQIPVNFSIHTMKMSELLNDSITVGVTEIKQEETKKPEPPPPPPPANNAKSEKSPAKKTKKQKSGNN